MHLIFSPIRIKFLFKGYFSRKGLQIMAVSFYPGDIPAKPGVYIYRDTFGTVIYVGKASNLRRRMSQYFQPSRVNRQSPKLRSLIHSICLDKGQTTPHCSFSSRPHPCMDLLTKNSFREQSLGGGVPLLMACRSLGSKFINFSLAEPCASCRGHLRTPGPHAIWIPMK